MKTMIKKINGVEHEYEIIEDRAGYTIDEAGYQQPTHNLYVAILRDVDTGAEYMYARDNGSMDELTEREAGETIDQYLSKWDDDTDFRAENII